MPKDFAQSFDQRMWESACRRHALWTSMLTSVFEKTREHAREQLDDLEEKYPQLKQSIVKEN